MSASSRASLQWSPALKAGKNGLDLSGITTLYPASMEPGFEGREEQEVMGSELLEQDMLQWSPALKAGKNLDMRRRSMRAICASMEPGFEGREELGADPDVRSTTTGASMEPGFEGREEPEVAKP